MFTNLKQIFAKKNRDLLKRILFTLAALIVFKIGTTIIVPGINNNGEYLPPMNIDDTINDMQLEYWQKFQEQQAENSVKQQNTAIYGGYGFNYYGTPYYNPYQYNNNCFFLLISDHMLLRMCSH